MVQFPQFIYIMQQIQYRMRGIVKKENQYLLENSDSQNNEIDQNQSRMLLNHPDHQQSKYVRKFWTKQEDQKLSNLVQKYGVKKWTLISKEIPGRCPKRCRQRWMNYLDSNKNNIDQWSIQKQWVLYLCYQFYGSKWVLISELMNIGDNHIKNQFHRLQRKKFYNFQKKLKEILQDHDLPTISSNQSDLETQIIIQLKQNKQKNINIIRENITEEKQKVNTSNNVINAQTEKIFVQEQVIHVKHEQQPKVQQKINVGVIDHQIPINQIGNKTKIPIIPQLVTYWYPNNYYSYLIYPYQFM